jgi:hypothetical protein
MKYKFLKKEYTDSGLALTLILLLIKLFFKVPISDIWIIIFLILTMTIPRIFYPFTILWLNFSDFLGQIMSKVILFFVYILFVIPVALIRRILGKDSLKLKLFKNNSDKSVFISRNHLFTAEDMKSPY